MPLPCLSQRIKVLAILLVSFSCLTASELPAQTTEIVLFDGDSANGNGVFNLFREPIAAMGSAGYMTVRAEAEDTIGGFNDSLGIYQTDGETLIELVRRGDPVPDGDGLFNLGFTNRWALVNRFGQIAFENNLRETSGGSANDEGVWLADTTGVYKILREGDVTAEGDGVFDSILNIDMNDLGQVVAFVFLDNQITTLDGIYVGDGITTQKVALEGETLPRPGGGNTTVNLLREPTINDQGEIAFRGHTASGTSIYLTDLDTTEIMVSVDDPIPGGDGEYGVFFGGVSLNNLSEVAFTAFISGGDAADTGIFLSNGSTDWSIILEGDPAPDGNGTFEGFGGSDDPLLNDKGQILIITEIDDGPSQEGIFRADRNGVIQIAREDYPVPFGVGTFHRFDLRSFNNCGQVAFHAELNTPNGSDNEAIYFYDDELGLLEVAREGQELMGSTIANLEFTSPSNDINTINAINDLGQVTFTFRLNDFRYGIAVWTPPITNISTSEFSIVRGVQVAGGLEELVESDDTRLALNPGFVLNNTEAPVWLEFEGRLPTDHPQDLQVSIESQAGTPSLTYTFEAWNFANGNYDIVDVSDESFNVDNVNTISLGSSSSDYAESLSGLVRTRVGWRQTGFTINFPWEVRIDQVSWIPN